MESTARYVRDIDNPNKQLRPNEGITPEFFLDYAEDQSQPKVFDNTTPRGPNGYPLKQKEFIRYFIAGDKNNRPVEKVTQAHRERFAIEYEAFKRGSSARADGTPIEEWPGLDPVTQANLKVMGFFTVEQVAGMNDAAMGALGMGGRMVRDRAKIFIETSTAAQARRSADANRHEIDELRAEIARLKSGDVVAAPRRGRPPKVKLETQEEGTSDE